MIVMAIGTLRFEVPDEGDETPPGIAWKVTISSSRKVQKKVADKDDDATVTDQGREVREVKIEFSWRDDEESNKVADLIVEKLDASNAEQGDPPAFAYERNGMDIAKRKNVRAVKWEKAEGPDADDATGKMVYKLTGSSWSKPKPSPGAGTPKKAQKFVEANTTAQGGNITFPRPVRPQP